MGPRHSPHAGQPIMVNGGTPGGGHHRVSPFTRSGTLPMNYQHHPHHPRSVSCDHTGGAQTLRLTPSQQTHQKPKHSLQHHPQAVIAQQQARPGYVTLPRRPRSSWSVPPRDSPSPSVTSSGGNNNALYVTMQRPRREPIYDGVGPRTSADGSSMSTLPRGASMAGSGMTSPAASIISHQKYSLGPYYAPIAELQEFPTTTSTPVTSTASTKKGSEDSRGTNTPVSSNGDKNNSSVAAENSNKNYGREFSSSSEMTLMEESISSYCEPFGKALAPPLGVSSGAESTPTPSSSKSRHSTTSAESELEALIVIPNGKHHHSPKEHKLEEDIPPMMPLLPPILTPTTLSGPPGGSNGHGISETSTAFNGGNNNTTNGVDTAGSANLNGNSKKVPPKTLPKPKVRPLPPPKPSKSSMLKKPVVFQDEGADGSEV